MAIKTAESDKLSNNNWELKTNSFYATSAGKYRHVLESSGFSLIFGTVLFLELLSANAFTSHNLLHRKMYSKKN